MKLMRTLCIIFILYLFQIKTGKLSNCSQSSNQNFRCICTSYVCNNNSVEGAKCKRYVKKKLRLLNSRSIIQKMFRSHEFDMN